MSWNLLKRLRRPGTAVSMAVAIAMAGIVGILGLSSAAPVSSFTFSPPHPAAGTLVLFTDTSSGSPTSWSWDFGDGTKSSDRNPSHVFPEEGDHSVRLD